MRFSSVLGAPVVAALLLCSSSSLAGGLDMLQPKSGKVIYVSPKGKNKNDGTAAAPMKNIDKAIAKAKAGDTIAVAEGRYKGTFSVGLWELDKDLHIYGGFAKDFKSRDVQKHITLLQPDNTRFDKSGVKPFFAGKQNFKFKDLVIDGFVFEQGEMTPYEKSKGKPDGVETGMMRIGPGMKNPDTPCLNLQGDNIRIRHNVFVNCAGGGVRLGLDGKQGAVVENNVFVANRYAAVNSRGLKPSGIGKTVVKNNTILFTWTRAKDFQSQGYGVEVLSKTGYVIENNIIALNIGPGINSQRFNTDIVMNGNLFWGNKKKDLWFNPSSNVSVQIDAAEFEDLEVENDGNENKPTKLDVNPAYLAGVISASYSEKVDYDPESPANLMRELFGLNKQGKIQSKVTMFANRYPWKNAVGLFGAVKGKGAQKP